MVTIKVTFLKEIKGVNIKGMEIERGNEIIMLLQLALMKHIIKQILERMTLMMNAHFILLLQGPL